MNIKELEKKSPEELQSLLNELNEQLHAFRFQVANMQLNNVSQIQAARKNIARIQTEIRTRSTQNTVTKKSTQTT